MNARKLKSSATLFSMHTTDNAYRGYVIVGNAIYGCYYIQKDNHNISSANNLAEAKATIDMLVS